VPRRSYRVQFPGGCGHELAGIIDRPDHRDAFPVAVFSHCFTCNKDLKAIVRISRALADLGIGVLRFDMTGLGGSRGDFSYTSFSTNLADLKSAVRFASKELGPVTALMGLSFGGAASLAIAGSQGTPAGLAGPAPAVVTLAAPSDTVHLAHLLAIMDPQIESRGVGSVTIGGRDWNIRRAMLEDFRRYDLPAAISRIKSPTLLFHSPADATVSFDHAIRIMGLIQAAPGGGGPVSLIALDEADHLLAQRQEDIDLVASTTAAFLSRYAQPR
jgi:putative redox protein